MRTSVTSLRTGRATAALATAIAAIALGACAPAAAAADRAWVTFAIGDGQRLIERWNGSVYARLWQHDALADARAGLAKLDETAAHEVGVAPLAALADCRGFDLRFLGMQDAKHPRVVLQAVFGTRAPELFASIRAALAARAKGAVTIADAAVPTADEACSIGDAKDAEDHAVLARFAGTLVLAINPAQAPAPLPPSVDDADLVVAVDAQAIRADLKASQDPKLAGVDIDSLVRLYGGDASHRLWIERDGIRTRSEQKGPVGLLQPAERQLLARLPAATTVYASVFGIDGGELWKATRRGVLPFVAPLLGGGEADDPEAHIDDLLAGAGIPVRIGELAEGLVGSCVFAISNAAPIGITIAVPRSAPLDRLIETVLRKNNLRVPAEGQAAPIAPPGLPVSVMLARDLGHWLVTSDLGMASAWTRTQSSGWADNPAGRLAIAKAPADATLIAGLDLPQAIRMAAPWIAMALSREPSITPERRQAIAQFLADWADLARPEYTASWVADGTAITDYRGTIGGLTGIYAGVVAGFAIPTLLHQRANAGAAGEAAAAAALKSGIFPAEIQFQAGGYCDEDGNNVGEYGFIGELGGDLAVGALQAGQLHLLVGPIASGAANGYHFAVHLPDGDGELTPPDPSQPRGAAPHGVPADAAAAASIKQRERCFVAYAWPDDATTGQRMFALDQSGQVFVAPADGEPVWNALYGADGTWGGAQVWTPYRR